MINWDMFGRKGAGDFSPALTSLADAVAGFRERQLRQRQIEQQAAQHAAELEQQRANQDAIRDHERARLTAEQENWKAQRADRARERQQDRALQVLPGVMDALGAGDVGRATTLGRVGGYEVERAQPQFAPPPASLFDAERERMQSRAPRAIEPGPFRAEADALAAAHGFAVPGRVDLGDEESIERGIQEREQHRAAQAPPQYVIRGGEGEEPIMYSPDATTNARLRRGKEIGGRVQSFMGEFKGDEATRRAMEDATIWAGMGLISTEEEFREAVERQRAHYGRMDTAQLRAQRPRSGGGRRPGPAPEDRALKTKLDVEQEYMQAAESTLAKLGYVDVMKNERKLSELAQQVAGSADNAALAAIVSGAFTKYAQGGVGVISDQDLKVFWERIGGLGLRSWQAVQNVMDGTLYPEKQKIVQDAVNSLVGSARRHELDIGERLASNISALPGGAERLPRILQTYTPSYFQAWNAKRAKGGAPDAIDELDRQADAWLEGMKR